MPANLAQNQWVWTGWGGAPGYTSFYYDTIDPTALNDAADSEHTFFDDIHSALPGGVNISPPANARLVDGSTGNLFGFVPITPAPVVVTGSSSGGYSAVTGYVVNWLTTTPATHRTVVGRTFLVPMGAGAWQTDGTPVDAVKAQVQTAAQAHVTRMAPVFVVWRRPISGAGGSVAPVVAARVNDRAAKLTSRRQ